MTLFKIFSFLNIYDICNFIASSKKIAIINSKDSTIFDIVLKIKKYVLFSDIRRVNFFSIDYFSKNSSFVTKNFINFKNRTLLYENLTNSLINKRQIFIDGKKFSIDLLNNILKRLDLKKFYNMQDFYNLCNKVRIFTPIKIAIFENEFSKVRDLLETKSVIMKRSTYNSLVYKIYQTYFDSVRNFNHNFLSKFTKNNNYQIELENMFDYKLKDVFREHYKELNIFTLNLKKLYKSILIEKRGDYIYIYQK